MRAIVSVPALIALTIAAAPPARAQSPRPARLEVKAYLGQWAHAWSSGPRDLRLQVKGMDAACKLQVVNVEANAPGRHVLRHGVIVPGDPLSNTRDGCYGIRLTDAVARAAGLEVSASDLLLVRQVNPVTHRRGRWCPVRVNAEPAPQYQREQAPWVNDQLGVVTQAPNITATEGWQLGNRPGNSPVWYTRAAEQRAVPIEPGRLRVTWERGQASVTTARGRATTLSNLVQVENMRGERFSAPANLHGEIGPLAVGSESEPVMVRVVRPAGNATSATYLAVPEDQGRLVPLRPEGAPSRVDLGALRFSSTASRAQVKLEGSIVGSAGSLIRVKNLSRGTELTGAVKSDDQIFARSFELGPGDAFEVRVNGNTIRGIFTGPGALPAQQLAH